MTNTVLRLIPVAIVLTACGNSNSLGLGAPYDEMHQLGCKLLAPDALQTIHPDDYQRMADRAKELGEQSILKIEDQYEKGKNNKDEVNKFFVLQDKDRKARDMSTCK
jgi:hypothetical protein